ncbi:SDR family oxidoreductase [Phreatobacter sp.]|uniref:SDR family NAD(P)-dependent oxidoreductase n=1 Tax=Microcystis aeruginosa DA14 TaxID=1987506 RepID=A0A3E0MDQ3_MICAE|nr:SDR family oxidoreductase [Phreatobacter sp.]REJ57920.1 MAG: SDR family NAD(P)-dependent oxidoreductase [Microcystis aeruginosa DA14]
MFKDGLLAGKRILVTGGGTGLGREMAEDYLRLGATVHICGRRKGVLDETAAELMDRHGGKVITHAVDIRVAQAVEEMIEEIFTAGPLTGLVNNAAGNFISPTKDLSPRGFDAIAGIVFHGSFYVTLACGKRWITGGHKASVISILTTWIWNGGPFTVPSAMSKAGIAVMTQSLAAEWGRYGIRLNAIAPGPFPTKGAWERLNPGLAAEQDKGRAGSPMGRNGEMQELKNLATFLMADGCEYLTGQTIAIDGARYNATGGNFYDLSKLSDGEWQAMSEMIRAANEKDRASRTA